MHFNQSKVNDFNLNLPLPGSTRWMTTISKGAGVKRVGEVLSCHGTGTVLARGSGGQTLVPLTKSSRVARKAPLTMDGMRWNVMECVLLWHRTQETWRREGGRNCRASWEVSPGPTSWWDRDLGRKEWGHRQRDDAGGQDPQGQVTGAQPHPPPSTASVLWEHSPRSLPTGHPPSFLFLPFLCES